MGRRIVTILFLFVIFTFMLASVTNTANYIYTKYFIGNEFTPVGVPVIENTTAEGSPSLITQKASNVYTANFALRQEFIDLYAMLHYYTDQRMIDGFVKDNKSFIQKPLENGSIEYAANTVLNMQNFLNINSIEFIYVSPPSKVILGYNELPAGVDDFSNNLLDKFLARIKLKVLYLDLRNDKMHHLNPESRFFKTDHHWTIRASFDAYCYTLLALNKSSVFNFNTSEDYSNINYFNIEHFPNSFLGSAGQSLGKNYSGIDNYELITPRFKTDFHLTQIVNNQVLHVKSGDFSEALIYNELLPNKGEICIDAYTSYLGYGNSEKIIINNLIKNDYKLLVIGDSFSRPYTAFMSLYFKETRNIDTQKGRFDRNVYNYINEYKPDLVIMLYSVDNLLDNKSGYNSAFDYQ